MGLSIMALTYMFKTSQYFTVAKTDFVLWVLLKHGLHAGHVGHLHAAHPAHTTHHGSEWIGISVGRGGREAP